MSGAGSMRLSLRSSTSKVAAKDARKYLQRLPPPAPGDPLSGLQAPGASEIGLELAVEHLDDCRIEQHKVQLLVVEEGRALKLAEPTQPRCPR